MSEDEILTNCGPDVYSYVSVMNTLKEQLQNRKISKEDVIKKIDEFIDLAVEYKTIMPF